VVDAVLQLVWTLDYIRPNLTIYNGDDVIYYGDKNMATFHGSLTYLEFLQEWFGVHAGRELGNPNQVFTDNYKNLIDFVRQCKEDNVPAFMSVAPRVCHGVVYGVDRVFFDFDAKDSKQRPNMVLDVKRFVSKLRPLQPFIVQTFHGYHVYLFFKEGCIKTKDNDEAKLFYEATQHLLLNGELYESLDTNVLGDVKRIARVPLSWHERGCWCIVVDERLEPTKVRSLDYYRMYGLDSEFVSRTVKLMKITKETQKNNNLQNLTFNPPTKGTFSIRPCFKYALEQTEMSHQQRLALVIEAFWAGKTMQEIKDLFKNRRDYSSEKTTYQVEWELLKIKHDNLKPYRCQTLIELGYCIKNNCSIYNRKFQ